MTRFRFSDAEVFVRFMSRVEIGPDPAACWVWRGGKSVRGYGVFHHKKNHRAHRWLYQSTVGPVPEGMVVRHKCDNPPCVNPAHLVLGSPRDNYQDMIERGRRAPILRGDACSWAKSTEETVRSIRRLAAAGWTSVELSEKFALKRGHINSIIARRAWAHVTDAEVAA